MCRFIGINYHKIDFSDKNWNKQYSWTKESRDKFKSKIFDLVWRSTEAKRELIKEPRCGKRAVNHMADNFLNKYGWEIKEEGFKLKKRDWKGLNHPPLFIKEEQISLI
jgi:hypothetical protein